MPFNVGDIVLITHTGDTGRISNITRSAGRTAYQLVKTRVPNRQIIYNTDPESIFYHSIYFLEEELELTGEAGGSKRKKSNKKRKSYKKRKSNNKRKYNKKENLIKENNKVFFIIYNK